jgi:hypothetical protein
MIKKVVMSKAGVIFLEGKPGIGKTAIMQALADEFELLFVDLRLAQIDISEVAGIPKAHSIEAEDAHGQKVLEHYFKYCLPNWAIRANKSKQIKNFKTGNPFKGALIFFDELNRASLETRNAALQILNERKIGDEFEFADHVYMASAGNLGEEDGTEVEEFDSALWNRLVPVRYDLTFAEWKNQFAAAHVNPLIVEFIEGRPEYIWKKDKDSNEKAYATPRSWTNLSKLMGMNAQIDEALAVATEYGSMYVGSSINKFLQFLKDRKAISLKDILQKFPKIEQDVKNLNRSRHSEIFSEMKKRKFLELKRPESDNFIGFMKLCDADEIAAFIGHVLEEEFDADGPIPENIKLLKMHFKEIMVTLRGKYDK